MKKFIFLVLFSSILLGADSKYLKEDQYSNYDFRVFAGLSANYGYYNSDISSDHSIYSYGLYLGMPVFSDYEIILNKNRSNIRNFTYFQQSVAINIPLTSRKTRRAYIGIIGGKGIVDFKDNRKDIDDYFYGIHIGKRYKFTRNYYVRIEFEATKYNYIKSDFKGFGKDGAITFNYGFEYRF